MFKDFLNALRKFALNTPHIESIIIVGSYANGTYRQDSDIDVVIITSNKSEMVAKPNFVQEFGDVYKKQTEFYGACTSIRAWYKDEREIEFGLVDPSWIKRPLDDGTKKILQNGYKIIFDKKHYFENLELQSF